MSATIPDIKQEIDAAIGAAEAELQEIHTLENNLTNNLSPVFGQEVDIHTYTRYIGDAYPLFNTADLNHTLSSNTQKLEDVIKEILDKCPAAQKGNVTTVLNTIRATTRPDPETKVNLKELLIRTWSLVNMPMNHTNAFEEFIKNLNHNIETGGGCVPGIAARLVQPYTHCVLRMLQVAHHKHVKQGQKTIAAKKALAREAAALATEAAELKEALEASTKLALETRQAPVPTNTKQTKPVMPIAETKVHQEMIDPLTGQAMSPEQIRAQTEAFVRFQPTEEQRAARMADRAAEEAKAEGDFQRVLKESALAAQAGAPAPEQKPGTPAVEEEIKFTEEERRAQEELLARHKPLSPEEIAARTAKREQERLDREIEKAIARSMQNAPAPVAPKPPTPEEQPSAVRMVFSNQASALKDKPPAPSTNSAPAAEKKTQSDADRIREARLKRFGDGKKK